MTFKMIYILLTNKQRDRKVRLPVFPCQCGTKLWLPTGTDNLYQKKTNVWHQKTPNLVNLLLLTTGSLTDFFDLHCDGHSEPLAHLAPNTCDPRTQKGHRIHPTLGPTKRDTAGFPFITIWATSFHCVRS